MSNKIITKKDFFLIKEEFIFTKEKINSMVNRYKYVYPELYENYGKNYIINCAKSLLLKEYFENIIIEIEENIYVKGKDFVQLIRFENGQILCRFIPGLYDINLCDFDGNYIDKKLYGILLSNFKVNGAS